MLELSYTVVHMRDMFVDVPGLEGLLAVTREGRVLRRARKASKWQLDERELTVQHVPAKGARGGKAYRYRTKKVILTVDGKIRSFSLNSLLRKTFGADGAFLSSTAERGEPVSASTIRVQPHGKRLPVGGFPGYWVFENGAVVGMRGEVLAQRPGASGGYLMVQLRRDGKAKARTVHSIVLEAFAGPRPTGAHGCHGPRGMHDNSITNLRWDTPQANAADRVAFAKLRRHGLL